MGTGDLLHHTLTHQHDLIRDAHGLFLIVGNKDGGHLGFLLDTANF